MEAQLPDPHGDGTYAAEVVLRAAEDAWGNTSRDDQCGCAVAGGRTTWFLCREPAAGILVQSDGVARRACKRHLAGAKRRRSAGYYSDPVAILALDGTQTHSWERTGPGRGYFAEA